MIEILPLLAGGLVLFLYSIGQLSDSLKKVFGPGAKKIIGKYTSSVFSALIVGTVLTILLGSSSAVIILTIVFINAETLSFKKAIGIIMGANIGTTFSSQLIALDIGKYAAIPLFIGLILGAVGRSEKLKEYGHFLLYFGMLFFGLYVMQESVNPLKESIVFENWIKRVDEDHLYGTLIGGLVTLIIQSSSGTVGIAIVLGKQNLLTLASGIAIMLGAELGTCSDTLLATIKGSRQALKAGLFHLLFNIATIIIGLILFEPFVELIQILYSNADIGKKIANAHVIFNLAGVLLFLPFVGFAERFLNWLIKEKSIVKTIV